MNEKLNIRRLSERIAAQLSEQGHECTVETAMDFVKDLFDTVAQTLANGESVEIKDLGEFVATGRAEEPVIFEPASEFASTVNEPFEIFEPQPLPDRVTDRMLSEIDQHQAEEPESVIVPAPEPDPVPEPTAESEPEISEFIPSPEVEEVEVAISDEVMESEPEPEPEPVGTESSQSISSVISAPPITERISSKNDPWVPEPEPEEEVDIVSDTTVPEVDEPDYDTVSDTDTEPEPEEEQAPKSSRFGIGFLCGLLTGLIIGAMALVLYVMLTPVPEYPVVYEDTETEQVDLFEGLLDTPETE